MSASMTLEEKFQTLIKNYNGIRTSNEELNNQNEYLRRQLCESMKQKRKNIVRS